MCLPAVEARFNGSLVNGTVAPFVVDTGEVDVSKTEIAGPAAANGVVQLAGNAFTMQVRTLLCACVCM